MILAFHSIWTCYGHWLPNEPRGSWSDFVASWELYQFGPATTVTTRRSIAHRPYDRALKRTMQRALKHPAWSLTDLERTLVARAILNAGYDLYALAVLPDHVHAVIARTSRDIRRIVGHLKSDATRALRAHGYFPDRPVWAEHGWNVYLDTPDDVRRCITYVNDNPPRQNLPRNTGPPSNSPIVPRRTLP